MQLFCKPLWKFLETADRFAIGYSSSAFKCIHPGEMKLTYAILTNECSRQHCSQEPQVAAADDWINGARYVRTKEYYLAMNKE